MDENAKKRKKYRGIVITAIFTLLLSPVFLVLTLLFWYINEIVALIMLVICIGLFITSMCSFGSLKKYCRHCRALLQGCAYEATPVGNRTRPYGNGRYTYIVRYNILYYCPDCGKSSKDIKEFQSNNGYADCQHKMNAYCIDRFGH